MANYNLTQTGAEVQVILDRVAAGYIYMGTADLTTTPDTTNPNVCYLLSAVGTYTNFGNIQHASGIGIALWNGTAWSYQNVPSSAIFQDDGMAWSENLTIESPSAYILVKDYIAYATSKWASTSVTPVSAVFRVKKGQKIKIRANALQNTRYAFITFANIPVIGDSSVTFADGSTQYSVVMAGESAVLDVPTDCYLYLYYQSSTAIFWPELLSIGTPVNTPTLGEDATTADLNIQDSNENIIAQFADGHFRTKNFDSANVQISNHRAYQRRTFWQQEVNTTNYLPSNFTPESINTYESATIYLDNCVLYLPESYTKNGTPTKIIIYCKYGASTIEENADTIVSDYMAKLTRYWLHLGYGILAADGVPNGWASAIGICERAVGNYVAVRSTIRAWEYVKANYNIDTEMAFIFGYSQGGHFCQNVIDNSNIPIYAAAEMSPVCSMRYHQWDLNASQTIGGVTFSKSARLNIARIFNYPTVSTNEELEALEYNATKTIGYDPWSRNVENMYTGFVQSGNLWVLPSGTSLDDIQMVKHTKCPLKIWACQNDATLGTDVTKVFIKAIKNGGQAADLQLYSTGNHNIPNSQTSIGTFTENGETCDLYPIAYDIAVWFFNYGGYKPLN